uniref:Uncharacterized protein n=1 Tax=Timema poppense TaxID=170557 RepID=A0A7R9DLK5_TIMPO|nr:unnamed protein product [Timema poppensis]
MTLSILFSEFFTYPLTSCPSNFYFQLSSSEREVGGASRHLELLSSNLFITESGRQHQYIHVQEVHAFMVMTRYKQAEFEDEDSSSVGSVQLTEGVSATSTHIRYHSGATLWKTRSLLEKCLLLITAILLLVVFIMGTLLSVTVRNENAMQVLHVGPHTAGLLLTLSI